MNIINEVYLSPVKVIQSDQKPLIILDKFKNKFEFSGVSIPDNVYELYSPVVDWFNTYAINPNPETVVNFKMQYISSSSSVMLMHIFEILQDIYKNGNKVIVNWYYHINDDDVRSEGFDLANTYDFPFEVINSN